MNVTLPEKKSIKRRQLILYISIMVICILSVIIAFYVEFYARIDIGRLIGIEKEAKFGEKAEEEVEIIKSEFDQIFINNIINEEDEYNNKKQDEAKELVYTDYQKKESKLNSYDLEVHIPKININNEVVEKYNKEIEEVFKSKTEKVLKSENKNIIYTVEYAATVQDGILSVMIQSNLKEGSSAQRVIIQTYNYDLRNNKEITLGEVLKIEHIETKVAEEQIKKTIEQEQKKVDALKELGYNIYSRDVSNDMYKVEKSTEFYLTNNVLYIVYAYGNETFTSEMDLVII